MADGLSQISRVAQLRRTEEEVIITAQLAGLAPDTVVFPQQQNLMFTRLYEKKYSANSIQEFHFNFITFFYLEAVAQLGIR